MDPEDVVRLGDAVDALVRDRERDPGLRRLALRQYFAAVTGLDEEMDGRLVELQATLELLRG
jgi:hypothetical protein